jgi:hypothetical protein
MAVSVIVFVEDVARSLAFYERIVSAELDHFDDSMMWTLRSRGLSTPVPRRFGSLARSFGAARR